MHKQTPFPFHFLLIVILLASWCFPVPAQEGEPGETPVVDMRYETWRLSGTGNTAVYRLKGGEDKPDRVELTLLDHTLGRFNYRVRTYQGELFVEEKKEKLSLKNMNRRMFPSDLRKQGIEFSTLRETFKGSVYDCQRFQYPDGRVEIFSEKIPVGGLLKRLDAKGEILQELVEIRKGRGVGSRVSQIKEEVIKSGDSDKTAMTVSDLLKGIRKEKEKAPRSNRERKGLVIGNVGKRAVEEKKFNTFIEEARLDGGIQTDKFSMDAPLLVIGYNRLDAVARYHVSRKIEPAEGNDPLIPTTVTIIYEDYSPATNTTPSKGFFQLSHGDKVSTAEIILGKNPYPEFKAYELAPEAVTILPGTFNCFHIRLVLPKPVTSVKEENGRRVVEVSDKKMDYWISNVKGFLVVVKKIETEKQETTRTSLEDPTLLPESQERLTSKKWTLVEFSPPE